MNVRQGVVKADQPERSRSNRPTIDSRGLGAFGSNPKSFRPLRPAWPIGELRVFSHNFKPLIDHPVVDLLDLALPDRLGNGGAGLGTHIAVGGRRLDLGEPGRAAANRKREIQGPACNLSRR